jgi:hypothetical protein
VRHDDAAMAEVVDPEPRLTPRASKRKADAAGSSPDVEKGPFKQKKLFFSCPAQHETRRHDTIKNHLPIK